MTAPVKNPSPIFEIDPQSLPDDTEVHLPPANVETQTTLNLDQDDIILSLS